MRHESHARSETRSVRNTARSFRVGGIPRRAFHLDDRRQRNRKHRSINSLQRSLGIHNTVLVKIQEGGGREKQTARTVPSRWTGPASQNIDQVMRRTKPQ